VEQFPEVRVGNLDWTSRSELLHKELAFHTPELLCVQELQGTGSPEFDGDHHSPFAKLLAMRGYDHRFVRKVRRNRSDWPHAQIGNAVFWRVTAFEYVEHEEVLIAPLLCEA
jgi:mRNA deadenylase 3'-5' endonuclease subunit Ccr4